MSMRILYVETKGSFTKYLRFSYRYCKNKPYPKSRFCRGVPGKSFYHKELISDTILNFFSSLSFRYFLLSSYREIYNESNMHPMI